MNGSKKKLLETLNFCIEQVRIHRDELVKDSSSRFDFRFHFSQILCVLMLKRFGKTADRFVKDMEIQNGTSGPLRGVEIFLAVMEALRIAIEHDCLLPITALVSLELRDDLLAQADLLLEEKAFIASGVLCRAALEQHLKQLCQLRDCMPPARGRYGAGADDMRRALEAKEDISFEQSSNAKVVLELGNQCAHRPNEIPTADAITTALRHVREFVALHPLDDLPETTATS